MRRDIVRGATVAASAALVAACSLQSFVIDHGTNARDPANDSGVPGVQTCAVCTPTRCDALVPTTPVVVDYSATTASGTFGSTGSSEQQPLEAPASAYVYPSATPCSDASAPDPITSTLSGSSLEISGTVETWSGFGLWIGCMVDFSAYSGISFDLWGDPGPMGTLTFQVSTDPDSPPQTCSTNVGTCDSAARICSNPSLSILVLPTSGSRITLRWSDLVGGSPQPTPDPARIVGLLWMFDWVDWAGNRSDPYPIDVHLGSVVLVP